MLPNLLLVASLASAAVAAVIEERVCGDNCARGVRNTARPGSADCSSYLLKTVTPSTVTSMITLTTSAVATSVQDATEVATVHQTATEVQHQVKVVTTTLPVLFKRAEASIPYYASACTAGSADIAYISACSCLGVLPTTVTAVTPSTLATVWETVTYTTTVLTSTVATSTLTEVDATTTQTITDATNVVTIKPERSFYLQIAGSSDSTLVGKYISKANSGFSWVAGTAAAQVFRVNYDNGYIYDGGRNYINGPFNSVGVAVWTDVSNLNYGAAPIGCTHDWNDILSCKSTGMVIGPHGPQPYISTTFGRSYTTLIWGASSDVASPLALKAIYI